MRTILPLAVIVVAALGSGEPVPSGSSHFVYEAQIDFPDLSAMEIAGRAKYWFHTAKKKEGGLTLVSEDPRTLTLSGKGRTVFESGLPDAGPRLAGEIGYDVLLSAKDGRLSIRLSEFTHTASGSTGAGISMGAYTAAKKPPRIEGLSRRQSGKAWGEIEKRVNWEIYSLLYSLKSVMSGVEK